MAEDTSKIPVQTDKTTPSALRPRRPLESLRQEIDRLFEDFGIGTWPSRSAGRFSIWTRFEEPKLHLAAGQRWTSPRPRRAIRS
jgi:hypothetical protein